MTSAAMATYSATAAHDGRRAVRKARAAVVASASGGADVPGGEEGAGEQQPGLRAVGEVAVVAQQGEGEPGGAARVAGEPGRQVRLAAVGLERGQVPRRPGSAPIAGLGPLEGGQGGGDVAPASLGEAEVVGRHGLEHGELERAGEALGLGQVVAGLGSAW